MPLYSIAANKLTHIEQGNFRLEKTLQGLIQHNLKTVFNCRLVASEFPTGSQHAGRIDTLALSEDNNPVIIEYKKVESSELINQSLYYLAWLRDHRGDFERATQKALGAKTEVDWTHVRVICIAPNYKKFDLYAVQVMGAAIELWAYRLYQDQFLYLEEVRQKAYTPPDETPSIGEKNPIMVAAGKKAALSRATGNYTFEQHLDKRPDHVRELALAVQEFMMALDPAMEEVPKKFYVAYKIAQNIVCMEVQKAKLYLYLKLSPQNIASLPAFARDVTDIGHFGTGDLELAITSPEAFEQAKPLIEQAYRKAGT